MKKRNTVYEDRAEKEEKRRQNREAYNEKHTVLCPHCGKIVLDHMTKCPHCEKELKPAGYQPMDLKKIRKIKLIGYGVCIAAAAIVIVCILIFK